MKHLTDRISAGETLVCDGGIGTMLFDAGLEPGTCPESVVLKNRELLKDIAGQYFEAGADIVETCTFGASPLKLSQYQLDHETERINSEAVSLVREVVGNTAYVGGSVGPSGKILEPYGDVSEAQVRENYQRQVTALLHAGVDCIVVETMLDINEAKIAVRAAKDAAPQVPVTATMTFEAIPRGFYTVMGVDVATAVSGLIEAGADAIGSNCGNGIEKMVEIARAFRETTDHPIMIQSNAGMPETESGKVVYRETPEFMVERARELLEIGVSIIGGCCGTTPEHIREFRALVDSDASHR